MTMRYRNGEIPESALVIFKRGHNERDGDFYWGLPASTYRKHLALIARALERTGRTLSPSDGWSTYRPLAAQVAARKRYGNGAAVPGKSSHGGFWEKRDTAAVDYGNWAWVYAKFGARAREEFYADCRAVGLTPGMISKARGYPDEPWHVIDLDPWAPVPAGSITSMEDEMSAKAEQQIEAVYAAVFGPANLHYPDGRPVEKTTWAKPFGEAPGEAYYGLFDVVIYSQGLIAQNAGVLAGLKTAVAQLSAGSGVTLDMAAIEAAAQRGAKEALSGLVLRADPTKTVS